MCAQQKLNFFKMDNAQKFVFDHVNMQKNLLHGEFCLRHKIDDFKILVHPILVNQMEVGNGSMELL